MCQPPRWFGSSARPSSRTGPRSRTCWTDRCARCPPRPNCRHGGLIHDARRRMRAQHAGQADAYLSVRVGRRLSHRRHLKRTRRTNQIELQVVAIDHRRAVSKRRVVIRRRVAFCSCAIDADLRGHERRREQKQRAHNHQKQEAAARTKAIGRLGFREAQASQDTPRVAGSAPDSCAVRSCRRWPHNKRKHENGWRGSTFVIALSSSCARFTRAVDSSVVG